MINGKEIDKVHYKTMLRSLQNMMVLGELTDFQICDQYQLMTDFCPYSGVLPSPFDAIVTTTPILSWQTHRPYQWFAKMVNEETNVTYYFTAIRE